MCTAISFKTNDHYFGRNLDLEYHYDEAVTITPRNYPFSFRCGNMLAQHYALIGMATVINGYPLYYDATNEFGLSAAGLNFPQNAEYQPIIDGKDNITPFEFIPWILGQCKTIADAEQKLQRINLADIPFSRQFPLTPLHWMISDKTGSLVAEPMADGLKIYKNPYNTLTNNPPFPYHQLHLNDYMNITREIPQNRFAETIPLTKYSNGMGGIGLPGDLSSASRFVRAAFMLGNSICDTSENASISQFFHIIDSVAQQRGCVRVGNDFEITYYSSCCNTEKGIYYYKTYENSQISAVSLHNEDLNGDRVITYPLITTQQIKEINKKPSV